MDFEIEMYGSMYMALNVIENCPQFAPLIPEVRSNFVYARESAESPEDVLGVDGRITSIDGSPRASGKLRYGASDHMSRLLIEFQKYDKSIRSAINFRHNPEFSKWLEDYCKKKGYLFSAIDRKKEPSEVIGIDKASMPWKIAEAVRSAGGKVPKMFYESKAPGKEPLTVMVGQHPVELAEEVCELARLWTAETVPVPKIGKIDLSDFEQFISARLGKSDSRVLVPPRTGVDSAVIDIGHEQVMVIAEDPIFQIPGQPPEMFGWYTVHIGASDVAVMGVKPEFMTYSLLMPPETDRAEFKRIVDSIHRAALELEIAIVGGHTGYYPGLTSPIIGGVTVFSIADKNEYITPSGARPGDDVLLTKGPAVETAGILANLYEQELLNNHPAELVEKSKAYKTEMSVVRDCEIAMKSGKVTAMHDATEGGVIGGLFEIASASEVGMEIDESKFIYPEEIRIVCELLDIDPLKAIAEGCLLLTADPGSSENIITALTKENIQASVIGKVVEDKSRRILKRSGGLEIPIEMPHQDPFWPAFFRSIIASG